MSRAFKKLEISQFMMHAIIILLLLLMMYPLAMAFWGAFKSDYNFAYTKWFPTIPFRVTNIAVSFTNIWKYILNTVIVAAAGTTGAMIIASISAYTFARMNFYGKNFLYMMTISLMMIPGILTLVPSFMIYKGIFGLNNLFILIAPLIVGGPIFGVFLLRAFFEGLPESIFESARIDGANEFKVYKSICLPMSMPILGTLAIMQIVGVWNDYMWPIITIQSDSLLTISAGLVQRFSNQISTNYPLTFSAYLLASLPLILLFTFSSKYYIEGLTSSGLKL